MPLLTELVSGKGGLSYRHGAPNGAECLGQHAIQVKAAENPGWGCAADLPDGAQGELAQRGHLERARTGVTQSSCLAFQTNNGSTRAKTDAMTQKFPAAVKS